MNKLTEEEISEYRQYVKVYIEQSLAGTADFRAICGVLARGLVRFADNLESAREETRWRTPDPVGVWKTENLPGIGDHVEITLKEHLTGSQEYPEVGQYTEHSGPSWRVGNTRYFFSEIAAWRPRPAPYTPPTEGENDGL